jgi:hypothetical protein
VAIKAIDGQKLTALYAIGPGIDEDEPAEWTRRDGRLVDDDFVFEGIGESTLHLHRRADDGLKATWISPDGKISMEASLRRIDPRQFSRRDDAQ